MPNRLNVRRIGIPTYEQKKINNNHHNPITTFILRYMRKIPLVILLHDENVDLYTLFDMTKKKLQEKKSIERLCWK